MIHILNNTIETINKKLNIGMILIIGLQITYIYNISLVNNKLNKLLNFNKNQIKQQHKKMIDYTNIELSYSL